MRRRGARGKATRAPRLRRGAAGEGSGPAAPTPVVLLSGFLGTGKTTLLKHWLENAEGRVGVIVNDVAAINIDSKLVKEQTTGAGGKVETVEMQNGCACCSLGDELLLAVADMLKLAQGGDPFAHIVIELSGVAEPKNVLKMFEDGGLQGCEISKVVTLVDSSTFCQNYMEYQVMLERADLVDFGGNEIELAGVKVVELLVEQVEAADAIVLNKTDLAGEEDLAATKEVVQALKDVPVFETAFGRLPLSKVVGVDAPRQHAHGHEAAADDGHAHSHSEDCIDSHCEHESHGHSQGHSHGNAHSHDAEACSDPECTDASHGHSHGQGHSHGATTAEERFGITSFTYSAMRPFKADRLARVLQRWPQAREESIREFLESQEDVPEVFEGQEVSAAFSRVIRSKGFCWIDSCPSERLYWSHAGKSMEISRNGVWWGSMSKAQLDWMKERAPEEYGRMVRDGWDEAWGDRRQELVFIGQRMDEAAVRALLDSCIVTDSELEEYRTVQDLEMQRLEQLSDSNSAYSAAAATAATA